MKPLMKLLVKYTVYAITVASISLWVQIESHTLSVKTNGSFTEIKVISRCMHGVGEVRAAVAAQARAARGRAGGPSGGRGGAPGAPRRGAPSRCVAAPRRERYGGVAVVAGNCWSARVLIIRVLVGQCVFVYGTAPVPACL